MAPGNWPEGASMRRQDLIGASGALARNHERDRRIVYLNNAATGWPKSEAVYTSVEEPFRRSSVAPPAGYGRLEGTSDVGSRHRGAQPILR